MIICHAGRHKESDFRTGISAQPQLIVLASMDDTCDTFMYFTIKIKLSDIMKTHSGDDIHVFHH